MENTKSEYRFTRMYGPNFEGHPVINRVEYANRNAILCPSHGYFPTYGDKIEIERRPPPSYFIERIWLKGILIYERNDIEYKKNQIDFANQRKTDLGVL